MDELLESSVAAVDVKMPLTNEAGRRTNKVATSFSSLARGEIGELYLLRRLKGNIFDFAVTEDH